jgi:energy-coupling factor transport system permease protein
VTVRAGPGPWHAWTWVTWAAAGAAAVQLAPNPLSVILVLGLAWLVVERAAAPGPFRRAFPVLVSVGAAFAALRVVLTALTTRTGLDAWFTLPQVTLPSLLGGFTVGGPVERDVVLQTAVEGLVVVGVMGVFGAFNALVSHAELLAGLPRAFHELGLVTTIGVTFVPSTIESVQQVREADRARTAGRVVRRGRLLRLVVPVLERGLEQGVALAESMEARGFGHARGGRHDRLAAVLALVGLAGLASAFVALVGRAATAAAAFGITGAGALVAAVAVASRGGGRPRYRHRRLAPQDLRVMAAVLCTPAALALLRLTDLTPLGWMPGPGAAWPPFEPLVAVALLPLLAPALAPPQPPARDPRPAPPTGAAR